MEKFLKEDDWWEMIIVKWDYDKKGFIFVWNEIMIKKLLEDLFFYEGYYVYNKLI